jgi:hypothetical protein
LTRQSVETASTRAAVIVGVNVPITSGKETGIINASWNICEVKRIPFLALETSVRIKKERV